MIFLPTPSARRATRLPLFRLLQFKLFLPTPSARRATRCAPACEMTNLISTHALREEGDTGRGIRQLLQYLISTHALREEGDVEDLARHLGVTPFLPTPSARRATSRGRGALDGIHKFLPTPSARRATPRRCRCCCPPCISTHALREEGDHISCRLCRQPRHFYPRPPRGGRLILDAAFFTRAKFLPTPSARRATSVPDWCPPGS